MNVLKTLSAPLAALALAGCQATPAQLAKKELAPVPPSLADSLPADSIAYFSLPDIPAMRAGMEKSALLRIYRDADVQNFIAGGLAMLDEAWVEMRAQAEAQGIPLELTHWEALRSFEAGFALRPAPGVENPFEQPPQIRAVARLGLAPGLGLRAYEVLVGMLGDEGTEIESTPERRVFGLMDGMEEGMPLRSQLVGTADAVEIELTWGAAGEGRLSDNDAFRRAWHRNATPGTAAFGFLRLGELMGSVLAGLRAEQPEAAALAEEFFERVLIPMDSASFASGWNDDGSFTHAALDLEAADPADPLWSTVPLDPALAEYVPAEATAFQIASGRSGPWMDLMLRTLDNVGAFRPADSPQSVGEILQAQVPELHAWLFGEHRPELDRAIGSFGTRSFSFTKSSGGLSAESFTFVELSDPDAMSAVLEQLMPRLREALKSAGGPVQLDMRRTKRSVTQPDGSVADVAGPAYYWLEFEFPPQLQQVLGFLGQTLQPCFGVAPEGWLVFSLSVQSVRSVLKDGMSKPATSILSNAEAQAFLASLPENAHAASWSDPRPALGAALGMVGGLLPMLSGMLGENASQLPVDLQAFPPAEAFVRHLRTSQSYSYEWQGDMRSSAIGSLGFADLFTVVGAAIAVAPPFLALAQSVVAEAEQDAPEGEPGLIEF